MPSSPGKTSLLGRIRRFVVTYVQPLLLGLVLLFLVLAHVVVLTALRPHTPGREFTVSHLTARIKAG